jgi:hypothetical protein
MGYCKAEFSFLVFQVLKIACQLINSPVVGVFSIVGFRSCSCLTASANLTNTVMLAGLLLLKYHQEKVVSTSTATPLLGLNFNAKMNLIVVSKGFKI